MAELAFPVLVADIGGTNARFALVTGTIDPLLELGQTETRAHQTLAEAIADFVLPRVPVHPLSFVFAIAGPVHPDVSRLTNCPWEVDPKALVARFGLEAMVLVNDFEAQAFALPALGPDDTVVIGDKAPSASGTRVVVGPGTGLGAAGLLDVAGQLVPVPGEGGHISVEPVTERDFAIWPHIPRPEGCGTRLSAEILGQGAAFLRLAEAIARTDGVSCTYQKPADVTAGAEKGEPIAMEAVELFCEYMGRVAGDLALIYLPKGGVYLAGGIAPRLLNTLKNGRFRAAFEDKWPHNGLMSGFATCVVTHPQSGLLGLAAYARNPASYLMDLRGRRWTH